MTKDEKREYNKKYAIENRERILENKRKYYSKNRNKIRSYQKAYYSDNKEEFTQSQRSYYSTDKGRRIKMITKAKERAKKVGLDFNITIDDFKLPKYCPFLGIELTHYLGKGQLFSNSSLDRIDNTKGYVKGNVQVISRLANTMKSNASKEQLLEFAKNIFRLYN